MRSLATGVLMLVFSVNASGRSDGAGHSDLHRQGLVFGAGFGPRFSTSMTSAGAGSGVDMEVGYIFSPQAEVSLRVLTGAEVVTQGVTRPVEGRLSLGGGGLEGTFFFSDEEKWRPFVAAGYELVTLLGRGGYNGSGPHVACGTQLNLSRSFALNFEVQYSRWRFYNLVGVNGTGHPFDAFVDGGIGGGVSLLFYPNILP